VYCPLINALKLDLILIPHLQLMLQQSASPLHWVIAENRRTTNFLGEINPISMAKADSLVNSAPQLSGQVRTLEVTSCMSLPKPQNSERITRIMNQMSRLERI